MSGVSHFLNLFILVIRVFELVTLNLGCGGIEALHTKIDFPTLVNFDFDPKALWLDIRGDAHCLPFDDNAFAHTLAYHVLEHCYNPYLVLREIARVTRNHVVIRVPNAENYKFLNIDSGHLYSWNAKTLETLLKKVFSVVEIRPTYVLRAKKYPRRFLSFLLILANDKQTELTALCKKK